jgi:hypothetical protein
MISVILASIATFKPTGLFTFGQIEGSTVPGALTSEGSVATLSEGKDTSLQAAKSAVMARTDADFKVTELDIIILISIQNISMTRHEPAKAANAARHIHAKCLPEKRVEPD